MGKKKLKISKLKIKSECKKSTLAIFPLVKSWREFNITVLLLIKFKILFEHIIVIFQINTIFLLLLIKLKMHKIK